MCVCVCVCARARARVPLCAFSLAFVPLAVSRVRVYSRDARTGVALHPHHPKTPTPQFSPPQVWRMGISEADPITEGVTLDSGGAASYSDDGRAFDRCVPGWGAWSR